MPESRSVAPEGCHRVLPNPGHAGEPLGCDPACDPKSPDARIARITWPAPGSRDGGLLIRTTALAAVRSG